LITLENTRNSFLRTTPYRARDSYYKLINTPHYITTNSITLTEI